MAARQLGLMKQRHCLSLLTMQAVRHLSITAALSPHEDDVLIMPVISGYASGLC